MGQSRARMQGLKHEQHHHDQHQRDTSSISCYDQYSITSSPHQQYIIIITRSSDIMCMVTIMIGRIDTCIDIITPYRILMLSGGTGNIARWRHSVDHLRQQLATTQEL